MRDGLFMIDANVVLKLYLDEEGTEAAEHLFDGKRNMIAPDFIVDEVLNVLIRNVPRKFTLGRLGEALHHLRFSFSRLIPQDELRAEATRIALDLRHSYYDCLYLALALRWDAPLITADDKFLGKIAGSAYRERAYRLDRLP